MKEKKDIKVERAERENQAARRRRGKSKRSKMERREEGEYSRLVFQLITTEGPGAAVRHIFFTNLFFFYYKH